MNNTVTIDIKEEDLKNLRILIAWGVSDLLREPGKKAMQEYPVTIYRQRMVGDQIITMQIELDLYFVFFANNMVK